MSHRHRAGQFDRAPTAEAAFANVATNSAISGLEDVVGLGLVQTVQHPGEHAGCFGADPLAVLLAEVLPLLIGNRRVYEPQAHAFLMAELGVEGGG